MGIYRLILAIFVLLSHVGASVIGLEGYNCGIVAVVSFLMISGYTMELLHEKYYGEKGKTRYFYIDRVIRIYPQYLFYSILTFVVVNIMKFEYSGGMQLWTSNMSVTNIIQCLLCFPMGYYMFNGLGGCMMIPQAWTLGLEISFYIVFPLIYKYRLYKPVIIGSLLFYLLPYFGILNTDIWGYRLLPGTLFIFLLGSLLARKDEHDKKFIILIYVIVVVMFIRLTTGVGDQGYTRATLAGFLLGTPIIWLLRDVKRNSFDKIMGDLSYGVYLNHFFIMFAIGKTPQSAEVRTLLILVSIILAFISHELIDIPAETFRINLRNKLLRLNRDTVKIRLTKYSVAAGILTICATIGLCVSAFGGKRVSTYIILRGTEWNASSRIARGISSSEGLFTWSDGNEIDISPVYVSRGKHKMIINIAGVYNGNQTIKLYHGERLMYEGSVNGPCTIEIPFERLIGSLTGYRLELPDAISPQSLGESEDSRVLALQLTEIVIE